MSVVLLARHAHASFGLGSYDRLSPQGVAQAEHLGRILAERGVPVARVVCGALQRQRATAQAVADAAGGLPVTIDPRWDEYDYLPLIVREQPRYRRRWLMVADLARSGAPGRGFQELLDRALVSWVADSAPDGPLAESRTDAEVAAFGVYQRHAAAALEEVAALDGLSVVVSSAGTIAAAAAPLLGVPAGGWPALQRVMVNTSLTKVVRGRRGITLVSFNEHGHLEGVPGIAVTYR